MDSSAEIRSRVELVCDTENRTTAANRQLSEKEDLGYTLPLPLISNDASHFEVETPAQSVR